MTPAQTLNTTLQKHAPALYSLLSTQGKQAFFPHGGILGQSAAAKGKRYNATIGIALEEDGSPMRLQCLTEEVGYGPKDILPYTSSFGKPELRELWQQMLQEKNPSLGSTITTPVVTAALTHGLTIAGYLFLDDGDELIVPDMHWGNYALTFAQQFAVKLHTIPTFKGDGIDLAALYQAVTEGPARKRTVLLNFPNNPTGYTPTETEVEQICSALRASADAGNQLVVLLDDAYFGLVYEDGITTESLFAPLSRAHENILAVKIDGATKEDYAWGLRVGFLTYGNPNITPEVALALEDKTAGAVRGTVSNCSHISQTMLIDAYKSPAYELEKLEKYDILKMRYQEVKRCLYEGKYEHFTAMPFNSGYFMCVKLAEHLDPETVRLKLLEDYDTGVIVAKGLIRIAYSSLPTKDIAQLFSNLAAACEDCAPVLKAAYSPSAHEPACV